MALKIGEIFVSLGLSTASFTKNLNDVKKLSFDTSRELERSLKIIGTAAVSGLAAAGTAFLVMARQTIDLAERLGDLSKQTGVSVEFLDKLRQIGGRSGVELEGFSNGLRFLARAMIDAKNKSREQTEAFQALKVSFTDLHGQLRPVEEVARDLIKAIGGMGDGAAKTEILVRLMGKAAAELGPAFDDAAKSLDALKPRITGEFSKQAKEFNDNVAGMKESWRGFVASATAPLLQQLMHPASALTGQRSNILPKPAGDEGSASEAASRTLARLNAEKILTSETQKKANEKAAAAWEKVQESIKGVNQRLLEEISVLKIGANATELFRLKALGASDAQLDFASNLQSTIEALKKSAVDESLIRQQLDPMITSSNLLDDTFEKLRESGVKVWEETRTGIEKSGLQLIELNDLFKAGAIGADTYGRAVRQASDFLTAGAKEAVNPLKQLKDRMGDFAEQSLRAFGEWIISGGSFRQMLAGILKDLARMIWELLVIEPLMEKILKKHSTSSNGGGGFWGGFFNFIGSIFGGLFGGAGGAGTASVGVTGQESYAAGGRITPRGFGGAAFRGMPFLVGEKGPELFMPDISGTIIPNHKLNFGGGMGGGVTIVNNIDNRGADIGTTVKTAAMLDRFSIGQYHRLLMDRQARVA